jgi:hypothetical protein
MGKGNHYFTYSQKKASINDYLWLILEGMHQGALEYFLIIL